MPRRRAVKAQTRFRGFVWLTALGGFLLARSKHFCFFRKALLRLRGLPWIFLRTNALLSSSPGHKYILW